LLQCELILEFDNQHLDSARCWRPRGVEASTTKANQTNQYRRASGNGNCLCRRSTGDWNVLVSV